MVNTHIIKKYGPCRCEQCQHPIIQAEGPLKFMPSLSFSNHTIAFFLTSKFVDAQPFYRMEGILSRWVIETSRASLCKGAKKHATFSSRLPSCTMLKRNCENGTSKENSPPKNF